MDKIKELPKKLKNAYADIPFLLRKKVLLRFATGFVCFALFIAFIVISFQSYIWLPFLAISVVISFLAFSLLYDWAEERIIKLEGHCVEALKTFTKTKFKTVYFEADGKRIRVRLKEQFRKISQGDYIVLYIKDTTSYVFEDNAYEINDYIAIQVTSTQTDGSESKADILKELIRKKDE